jgi:hypothetical protein
MSDTDLPERTALKPFAVTIGRARELLAGKGRTQIYEAISSGELDAIKDGNRTLITVASIERYMAALPPAKFKPLPIQRLRHARQRQTAPAKRA